MQNAQYLTALGYGAKEGVVTALTFFLSVKSDVSAYGKTPCTNHRAIEVQGDAHESQ